MIDLARNNFIGVPDPEEIDAVNGMIACDSTTTSDVEMCDCVEELKISSLFHGPTLIRCISFMDCHSTTGFSTS